MKELDAGQSPSQPDWITVMAKVDRVYTEAKPIQPDDIPWDQNLDKWQELLDDFKQGIRVHWSYRDILWKLFKERNIDPTEDWKPQLRSNYVNEQQTTKRK